MNIDNVIKQQVAATINWLCAFTFCDTRPKLSFISLINKKQLKSYLNFHIKIACSNGKSHILSKKNDRNKY